MGTRVSPNDQAIPGYWTSGQSVEIPTDDIVSYAFGGPKVDLSKPIYVDACDPSRFITAAGARRIIQALSTGLKKQGLQAEDCVCIHSFNNIEYPLLWLGTIAAGGVFSGSNPAYTTPELIHHYRTTNARFIIAHVDCLSPIEEAIRECNIPKSRVFLIGTDDFSVTRGYASWKQLLEHGVEPHTSFQSASTQASTVAVYGATSGTTGLPKAAVITHRFVVAQASLLENSLNERIHTETVVQLQCLPVFHAFASVLSLVIPLRLGVTTYFLPRYKPADYIKAIHDFQITDTAVVPPIITSLYRSSASDHAKLQSLRYVVCAGAPMSAPLQEKFNKILHPSATVGQCWGTTELGWITVFGRDERDTSGSVGRLLPNMILKIVDSDGKVVSQEGQRGEARIQSPSMFIQYRGRESINQGTHDEEGFYCTGDSVYIKNGKIFVESRIKDIMKVNGWQVSPEELQTVIMQLEPAGVKDCAVIGHTKQNADGLVETLPRAYVVKASDCELTAQNIKSHVERNLVSYKKLSGGVVFVEQVPRSTTGKILRRLLETMTVVGDEQDVTALKRFEPSETWRYPILAVLIIPACALMGPIGLAFVAAVFGNRFGRWKNAVGV